MHLELTLLGVGLIVIGTLIWFLAHLTKKELNKMIGDEERQQLQEAASIKD